MNLKLSEIKLRSLLLNILNIYLLLLILLLFIKPFDQNYLNLDNGNSIIFLLFITIIGAIVFQVFQTKYKFITSEKALIILSLTYLSINIIRANSILLVIGFSLCLFPFIMNQIYHDDIFKKSSIIIGLFSTIKLSWMIASDSLSEIDKFIFDKTAVNYNHILIVGLCFILVIMLLNIRNVNIFIKLGNKSKLDDYFKKIVIIMVIVYATFLSILMYSRASTFRAPNFDMGIFTQAMTNIVKGNGPVTTLERDKVLSHFAVHVSPILYFLAPLYNLWPTPENLEILQVLITVSGIIPFYLIVRKTELSKFIQLVLLVLYLFLPTLSTSHFYDFHENCFLAPLVLWLIYSNIKGDRILGTLFTILLLMVKEDAVVYVVSIYLFFMFQNRFIQFKDNKVYYTIVQLVFPILYFFGCIYWLQNYGAGAMTTRFTNFMLPGQSSLLDVIVNTFNNPTFVLSSIFIQRKISYILLLLSCFAFLPLMQKSWEVYILLIPLFVINLLSDYLYQVDFGKQYNYGSSVLLLFMSVLALENIQSFFANNGKQHYKNLSVQFFSLTSVMISFFVLISFITPRLYTIDERVNNTERFIGIQRNLDLLPRNANVLAYSFYTPHLSDIYYLYDIFYHNNGEVDEDIDYLVAPRSILKNNMARETQIINAYIHVGYKESPLSTDEVFILKKGS